MRGEDRRGHERRQVLRKGWPLLEPAAGVSEAGLPQAALGVAGPREDPGRPAEKLRGAAPATASMTSRTRAMLPSPPHWISSYPPGSQRSGEPRPEAIVVGDPMQRGRREDRVHRLLEFEVQSVLAPHLGAVTEPLARASATMSAEASKANTCPSGTSASRASVTRPVPHPTSSTVASGAMPSSRVSTSKAQAAEAHSSGRRYRRPRECPPRMRLPARPCLPRSVMHR